MRMRAASAALLCVLGHNSLAAAQVPSEPGTAPAGSTPSGASTPEDEARFIARQSYQEGEQLYQSGDYTGAAEKFRRADELLPAPHAKYWLALSLDKAGRGVQAHDVCDALLVSSDLARLGEQRVKEVQTRCEELGNTALGRLELTTVPAARITVDGRDAGQTPVSLKLAPGTHKLILEAAGHLSEEVEVDIVAGKALQETLEMRANEQPPPPAPPVQPPLRVPLPAEEPESRSSVPAYVLLGLTGVSAGIGTYFGIKALADKSTYDDDPSQELADEVEASQLASDLAFGAALTFGVTAIVYLTHQPKGEGRKQALTDKAWGVTPFASRSGGGALARVKF